MTQRTLRLAILAAPLAVAGGLAIAQAAGDAPATDAPAAKGARTIPAQFLGGRDGGRGHGHGPRGAFGPGGMADIFAEVDGDGDGFVTQAEVDA